MSYCRWSSLNFKCDLYCYQDFSGHYVIHVAGSRLVGTPPPVPSPLAVDWQDAKQVQRWQTAQDEYDRWMADAEHRDIDLPYAGQSFYEDTLEDFRLRLIDLRRIGYRFPAGVLDVIEEEIAERDAEAVEVVKGVVEEVRNG